ncbi:hypothetical protein ACFOZY_07770 [Chungangia koreensis]|uniref:Uncharacterized protein n=1 Tax=Chungangia koreensis TaxID=752657 RepID=A0ABV8X7Q2_9LACT
MDIKWLQEEFIFETMQEADMWAYSLENEMYGRIFNGYITPDYKIASALAFRLAKNKDLKVYTADEEINVYKVWAYFPEPKEHLEHFHAN